MGASQSVGLSDTLDPLPSILFRGLIAVSFFGLLSLVTTSSLFLYLTYRLYTWYMQCQLRHGANQFFILVYNLVLADIQQAVAFALTTTYLVHNKLEVGTRTCYANGFFVSVGDLASSVFILNIGLHTFLTIVKGRKLSEKLFYTWIAASWAFVYLMAILTVTLHRQPYVRAGAWCWINHKYDQSRLWLHYIWIFMAMFGTIIIYALIHIFLNAKFTAQNKSGSDTTSEQRAELASTKRAAKYMVIYPAVYVVCTLPLAGGRMAAMSGIKVPYWYFCFAGSMITSCGWLDVVLYAITRHVLIFSKAPPDKQDMGLDTFGWYPRSEFYGVTTTVEAPFSRKYRDRKSRSSSWRQLRRKQSDEDHFANHPKDVILTKTTIEVSSIPMPELRSGDYARSETSVLDIDDKGL